MVNQFRIKIKHLYVKKYKVVKNKYVLDLNEDVEMAGRFDEDDAILELCRPHAEIIACGFRDELGTFSLSDEKVSTVKESVPEEFNWI
jgi:hypothetical protein